MNLLRATALAALLSLSAFADNPACHGSQGANETTVSVSAAGATTLVAAAGGQIVHVCSISLSMPAANTVTFQGSDATVLDGPYSIVSYYVAWDGQLTTRRAASGSAFQIKLLNAPAAAFGVTVIYYFSAF